MLAASIVLGIMILPTIISVSESAIRAVPESYYEGSLALGASHERSVFRVVLPAAASGVMAGVILGVGRAIGETMAVIMVAGNQAASAERIVQRRKNHDCKHCFRNGICRRFAQRGPYSYRGGAVCVYPNHKRLFFSFEKEVGK